MYRNSNFLLNLCYVADKSKFSFPFVTISQQPNKENETLILLCRWINDTKQKQMHKEKN